MSRLVIRVPLRVLNNRIPKGYASIALRKEYPFWMDINGKEVAYLPHDFTGTPDLSNYHALSCRTCCSTIDAGDYFMRDSDSEHGVYLIDDRKSYSDQQRYWVKLQKKFLHG